MILNYAVTLREYNGNFSLMNEVDASAFATQFSDDRLSKYLHIKLL